MKYKLSKLFKKRSLAAKKGWVTRRKILRKKASQIKKVKQKTKKQKTKKLKKHVKKTTRTFVKVQKASLEKALMEYEKKIKELIRENEELKKEQPAKPFVNVIEPVKEVKHKKTVDDYLINDPEFAFERGRMVGAMKYLRKKLQEFADGKPFIYEGRTLNPPHTYVDIDTAPLADGSVIAQAKFESIWGDDEEEFRMFTLFLESYIHSLGPMYRVSIVQQWNPEKLTIPYDEKEGTLNNKPGYDFYKGLLDIAQNVSTRIADSFDTTRDFDGMVKLREKIGYPDHLTVRVVWGESVVRMSRKAARV